MTPDEPAGGVPNDGPRGRNEEPDVRRRRAFVDARGRAWMVIERAIPPEERTPGDDQAEEMHFHTGWLYFESGAHRRRLLLYPRAWHELSDGELERLCRRARRVA
jgi:hypothetical protein